MKLIVCTSSYRNKETVDLLIDSLILQSYKNWELKICDDNFGESHYKYLKNISNDKRIKIIKNKENQGLTVSLIKLIESLPKDSYIIRMDDDELHTSEYLISIANLFKRGHDLIVYCENLFLSRLTKKIHNKSPLLSALFISLIGNIASHGGMSYTKECYSKSNGYSKDFRLSQDYNLLIKLLKVSKNPCFVNSLNYKPFDIERKSYKLSKSNKNMQKIFALISIIGIFNQKHINNKKTFFIFLLLLAVSIPVKFCRSILFK